MQEVVGSIPIGSTITAFLGVDLLLFSGNPAIPAENPLVSIPSLANTHSMNLADAKAAVVLALGRMNSAYNKVLFDEWVLVKVTKEEGMILSYEGPRRDGYQARFKTDVAPLQAEMHGRNMAVGDFEFTHHGPGTFFDAGIRLGPGSYLFCNNTSRSMLELRQDPLWLAAQKPFLDLAAKFREDPLV